ncbi:type II toxin-antitoxin system prevent-host-death family antitoxin [Acidobacteria bacterium AH-259-D05]|nr:type II toxin-antitoxin system prevent-host-death family antitoxin [Acidobacteria bacterium AH-259-D05]
MTSVTITELRANARKYFDRVAAGEVLQVFRRGKPVAEIVPYRGEPSRGPRWKNPPQLVRLKGQIRIADVVIEERQGRG